MEEPVYVVGDKFKTCFSDQKDGLSTILAVEPYRGKYTNDFKYTLKLTAPRTRNGWLEMAV